MYTVCTGSLPRFPEFKSETKVEYPKSPQICWSNSTQKLRIPKCPKSTIPLADLSTLFHPYNCVLGQSYECLEFMSKIPIEYPKSPQICAYNSTQKLRIRNSPEIPIPLANLLKLVALRYRTYVPKLCSEFP